MNGAYYNENDPFAAAWLKNLISQGHIAPGDVDTRSIVDVRPDDVRGYTQCHFFAGIGGWSGALRLASWPDQRAVWTGSCPCQPFSLAGKQKGFADDRHLWPVWRELIAECRPAVVYGEQVASASAWLGLVRGDLEALDYAVGAIPCEAASAGADHLRDRYWFVGHDTRIGQGRQLLPERAGERTAWQGSLAHADLKRCDEQYALLWREERERREGDLSKTSGSGPDLVEWVIGADGKARRVKPGVRLLADGVPCRVAKLRALGNAIDLRPAAAFIKATM